MRVLVTGAHGFIGSHTCEHLLAEGYDVRALVSPWGGTHTLAAVLTHPRLELRRADITQPDTLEGICDGCEGVIHAAARVADWGPWEAFEQVNVKGTKNLLLEAERSGVERFVLVSSVAVHRYTGFRNALPGELPRDNTDNPYARSKILAEDAVLARTELDGLIIRPGLWPFGPRDPNFRRVVKALKQGLLPMVGDGNTVINTAYIGNLVLGLERALRAQAGERSYVIADEGQPTWKELFTHLAMLLGVAPPRLHLPPRLVVPVARLSEGLWQRFAPEQEPPLTRYRANLMLADIHFSLTPSRHDLDYRPGTTWEAGLAATVARLPGA